MATVYSELTLKELNEIAAEYGSMLGPLQSQMDALSAQMKGLATDSDEYQSLLSEFNSLNQEWMSLRQNLNDIHDAKVEGGGRSFGIGGGAEDAPIGGSVTAYGGPGSINGGSVSGGSPGSYAGGGGMSSGGGGYGGGGGTRTGNTGGGSYQIPMGQFGEQPLSLVPLNPLDRFGGMFSGPGSGTGIGAGPIGTDYDSDLSPISGDPRNNGEPVITRNPRDQNSGLSVWDPDTGTFYNPYETPSGGITGGGNTGSGGGTAVMPRDPFQDMLDQYDLPPVVGGGSGAGSDEMTLEELLALLMGIGETPGTAPPTTTPPATTPPNTSPPTDATNPAYPELLEQYNQAYQRARADNEARYNSINAGYDDLVDLEREARQTLTGDSERADLAESFHRQRASAEQDLISRGLGNTTVRPTVIRGINADENRAQTRLDESIARLNMDMLQNPNSAALAQLEFQERRTDSYPDLAMMMNLFNQLGEGGVTPAQGAAISNAVNTALGGTPMTPAQIQRALGSIQTAQQQPRNSYSAPPGTPLPGASGQSMPTMNASQTSQYLSQLPTRRIAAATTGTGSTGVGAAATLQANPRLQVSAISRPGVYDIQNYLRQYNLA